MGRGRVDPASPASINSDPKGRKRRGRNDKKRGGKPRERERESEREREREREREKPIVLREKRPKQ
jgi:hypothetical protein